MRLLQLAQAIALATYYAGPRDDYNLFLRGIGQFVVPITPQDVLAWWLQFRDRDPGTLSTNRSSSGALIATGDEAFLVNIFQIFRSAIMSAVGRLPWRELGGQVVRTGGWAGFGAAVSEAADRLQREGQSEAAAFLRLLGAVAPLMASTPRGFNRAGRINAEGPRLQQRPPTDPRVLGARPPEPQPNPGQRGGGSGQPANPNAGGSPSRGTNSAGSGTSSGGGNSGAQPPGTGGAQAAPRANTAPGTGRSANRNAGSAAASSSTPREIASQRGAALVKEFRTQGVGQQAGRSGGHGEPFKRAGAELIRQANLLPRNNPLREALKIEGRRLIEKGNAISHRGGRGQ